jgi:hypothetical protein
MAAQPMEYPTTPNLDKIAQVSERSNLIGEFVAEFLAGKGIVLAEWRWIRHPCWKVRGSLTADPYCSCPAKEGEPFPHAERQLTVLDRSDDLVNRLLAEFFEIDPDAAELERRALLDWLRRRREEG